MRLQRVLTKVTSSMVDQVPDNRTSIRQGDPTALRSAIAIQGPHTTGEQSGDSAPGQGALHLIWNAMLMSRLQKMTVTTTSAMTTATMTRMAPLSCTCARSRSPAASTEYEACPSRAAS